SNNLFNIITACALVNAPSGLNVVLLVPIIIPSAFTFVIASTAQCSAFTSVKLIVALASEQYVAVLSTAQCCSTQRTTTAAICARVMEPFGLKAVALVP